MVPTPFTSRPIRSSLAIAVACLALACAPQSSDTAEADVTAAIESFYGAIKSGDAAAAMAVIAPDAMFVEAGGLETRDEYEKNHLPADIAFEKQVDGTRGPWRITIDDDKAWAIATTEYDGTFDGNPVSFTSAQLAVLTRGDDDRWLIRAIHWSSRRR